MTKHARIEGNAVIEYPITRDQAATIVQAAAEEGVDRGLPDRIDDVDLSEWGILPVALISPPVADADEVVEEAAPVNIAGNWCQSWAVRPMTAEELAARVPTTVSMRQARLALHGAGILSAVDVAIAALPSPEREVAEIEWAHAVEVRRDNALISALLPALGLSSEDVDALFVQAAGL